MEDILSKINRITTPNTRTCEVLDTYNEWADTFDRDLESLNYVGPKTAALEVINILGNKKDAAILDVAAGTGLTGQELHKQGYVNIDAVDGSKQMLERAREKGVYKNIICALLGPQRLPIETDAYDVCVGIGFLIPGHADEKCLDELYRITKPGGHIVLLNNKKYLDRDELANLEPALQLHQDTGLCKLVVKRTTETGFYINHPGVLHILQVL